MSISCLKHNTALTHFLNKKIPDRNEWLFISLLTIILTFVLYENVLNGYWRFDDGYHLKLASEYNPWEYFFDPVVSRAQSNSHITPWNVFFYDINLSLFGLEPGLFYLHLLVLIIATALALYSLLRLYLPLLPSALAVLLFLLGKPTLHMANEIMSNHYLTGMMFSLLSVNIFIRYIRHGGLTKLVLSLFLYLLAMTCKEIYVPLCGILFAIPIGNIKQRFVALLPFGFALIGYAFWRHTVLGVWVGGYGKSKVEINYQTIIEELLEIPVVFFSDQGWGLLGLIIIATMSLIAFKNKILNLPLILMSLFVILTPLILLTLVINIMGESGRYFFLPWVAMTIWVATIFQLGINNTFYSIANVFCAVVLIISSFICQRDEFQKLNKNIQHAEDIYHFIIESDSSKKALILDNEGGEYWASAGLSARYVYNLEKNTAQNPIIITDTIYSLLSLENTSQADLASIQFYRYQYGLFQLVDIKAIVNTFLTKLKQGENQPLKVKFDYDKGWLNWEFHPDNMVYIVVLLPEKPNIRYIGGHVSKIGSYPWKIEDEREIIVSFKSPSGWIATTPIIKFQRNQKTVIWQGKTGESLMIKKLALLLLTLEK